METSGAYPLRSSWATGELSPLAEQNLRGRLAGLRSLRHGFWVLGTGLQVGSSRTLFELPTGQEYRYRNPTEAMFGAVITGVTALHSVGLAVGRIEGALLRLHEDMAPRHRDPSELIHHLGASSYNGWIGYMCSERNGDGSLGASVGALGPSSQMAHSLPLGDVTLGLEVLDPDRSQCTFLKTRMIVAPTLPLLAESE